MSKLLKGKRVFIDTQAFRKARLAVSGPAFKKLSELAGDGEVILVTTEITRREIEAQISEVALEIRNAIAKAGGIAVSLGQEEPVFFGMPSTQITEQQVESALRGLISTF